MGSFSRLHDRLKEKGVSHHDLTDVTYAIELLKGAGDDLSDILFEWYDQGQDKEKMIDAARAHILKLQKAIDRIAISK